MTALLEQAVAQAVAEAPWLSEAEQNAIAERLLQTLAEVRREHSEEPGKTRPQFGSAKGKVFLADDFDAPLEDFKDYM